jgi:hypothetical protein
MFDDLRWADRRTKKVGLYCTGPEGERDMTTTEAPPIEGTAEQSVVEKDTPAKGSVSEELKIDGEQLLAKIKELIHEGNIRRIIIKNGEGVTLMEVPLTLGVAGAVLLPSLAAVGAIAALVTDCSITVERLQGEA